MASFWLWWYTLWSTIQKSQNIETIQYNTALTITGAIYGTSQIKLYHQLGLETLEFGQLLRKLCFLRLTKLAYQNIYSIWYNNMLHIATISTALGQLRQDVITFYVRADVFKYSDFPHICHVGKCPLCSIM